PLSSAPRARALHPSPPRRSSDLRTVPQMPGTTRARHRWCGPVRVQRTRSNLYSTHQQESPSMNRSEITELIKQARIKRQLSWAQDRKSTRLNSSHVKISYAVFCL